MNTYLIASMRENAGKTSFIIGLAAAQRKKYGYLKPFGDRLIYQRKKNWDYDANLIIKLWGLDEEPESVTMGFNHAKLRYVHDEEGVRRVIGGMVEKASAVREGMIIEGGRDICYGASVFLDSLTIACCIGAEVIIVVSGEPDAMLDDVHFIRKYFNLSGCGLKGVVFNKVRDPEDFKETHMKSIAALDIPVLGVIPYEEKLTHFSMHYLADALFAKVLGGEKGLDNIVKHFFVGATSTEACMRNPVFGREGKLIITSGDRDDMILAALESESAGIVLTNNIIPPSKIIAQAAEQGVPLLLVAHDTFQAAKQIERLEALITAADTGKIAILADLIGKNVSIKNF
ncbi:MAG: AAA family ATPase [Deltaproteobacteria bacterium]|nr:AAA family ATPase [Deltaproteobacteria bacterium]